MPSRKISEKNTRFLYRRYISKKEFEKEFKRLYNKKSDLRDVYITSLFELEKSIIEGNLKNFNQLVYVIGLIAQSSDQSFLAESFQNVDNPFRKSNIIILCCKHNKPNVLAQVFDESQNKVLEHFNVILKRNVGLHDLDELNHNSMYYAIRSCNPALFDMVYQQYKAYFSDNLEKLDELLSEEFDGLKLRNVPLNDEIKVSVETKLIDLRFFSKNIKDVEGTVGTKDHILERLNFVFEIISTFLAEYSDVTTVDDKYIFLIKSVLHNIHILKQQLKSTYERVPWEEVEYCLAMYISQHSKFLKPTLHFFCKAILTREKIMNYLVNFLKCIKNEKTYLEANFSCRTKVPRLTREDVIKNISKKYPELEKLFTDFEELRDIDSLIIINSNIHMLLVADPKNLEGQLAILRALQITGEFLKNTLESPKMSEKTGELFLYSLPKTTRDLIINIRNSLSHAPLPHLNKNVPESFFSAVQDDMKRIENVISNVLYNKQMSRVKNLIDEVISASDFDKMKEGILLLSHINPEDFSLESIKLQYKSLKKFVDLLNAAIIEKPVFIKTLFEKIKTLLDEVFNTSSESLGFLLIKTLKKTLLLFKSNESTAYIRSSFCHVRDSFLSLNKSNDIEQVLHTSMDIFFYYVLNSSQSHPKKSDKEIFRLACEIVSMGNIKNNKVLKLRNLLKRPDLGQSNAQTTFLKYNQSNINLAVNLSQLKVILKNNKINRQSSLNFLFSCEKILLASIEMKVLEILSALSGGKHYLENNVLFLDDHSPVLIGKSLRNHLAHGNVLLDLFSPTAKSASIINAIKLGEIDLDNTKKKIGKFVQENPLKLKMMFHCSLNIIDTQEKLFIAARRGELETFKECLNKGADIYGSDLESSTVLHYAAMGSNLELLKFVVEQKVKVDAQNINEETALHKAAAQGRKDFVECLLNAKANPDLEDSFGYKPLFLAIVSGNIETIELLINDVNDDRHESMPLIIAAINCKLDVFKFLLKKYGYNLADFSEHNDVIHIAAELGDIHLIKFLLEHKANVNAKIGAGYFPLLSASLQPGKVDVVRALLDRGAKVNATSVEGCSALYTAVFSRDESIVKILLDYGADVNIINKTLEYSCLYVASRDGLTGITAMLLERGANVNVRNFAKESPLHVAVMNGHTEIVDSLLKYGADVNAKNSLNQTPLHRLPDASNSIKIAELLIQKGADIHSIDHNGCTPLHFAAHYGNDKVSQYLMDKGAKVNISDLSGSLPLHAALGKNAKLTTIQALLSKGTKLNSKDINKNTPLHIACLSGNADAVSLLIEKKASVNVKNLQNHTPLQLALESGHVEVVKVLILNGALLGTGDLSYAASNKKNDIVEFILNNRHFESSELNEALFKAVEEGSFEIVQTLLTHKADVNYTSDKGYTPLHVAAELGDEVIVELLLKFGAKINPLTIKKETPLLLSALNGHDGVVETLIKSGADTQMFSSNNLNPLLAASSNGHTSVVKTLLDLNAQKLTRELQTSIVELAIENSHLEVIKLLRDHTKFDSNRKNSDGLTLLHVAVKKSDLEIIKYLVSIGANVNVKGANGVRAIHIAAQEGRKDIIEYLLDIGANISHVDDSKRSMLHYACEEGHLESVKFLIEKGINLNYQDDDGWYPLHYAADNNYKSVVIALLEGGAAFDVEDKHLISPAEITFDDNITSLLNNIRDLFLACSYKNNHSKSLTEVKGCIVKGVIINAKNKSLRTALHVAVMAQNEVVVNLLLTNKANPNVFDCNGLTPLYYAAKHSLKRTVVSLLKYGAVYNCVSKDGKTPADSANDQAVIDVISKVAHAFDSVENQKGNIVDELRSINDQELLKAVVNARNSEDLTLISAAIKSNFKRIDKLKDIFDDNGSKKIVEATNLAAFGNFQKSLLLLKSLLKKRQEVFGPDNPCLLEVQLLIAKDLYKQGDYIEALNMFEDIIPKLTKFMGPKHKDTLAAKDGLALVFHRLGRNKEAIVIYEELYDLLKDVLGPDDQQTLGSRLHMAAVLGELGRPEEALQHTEAVYKEMLRTSGPQGQCTIAAQNNVAMMLSKVGRCEESLKVYREVFEKKKRLYGLKHYDTLRTLHHIATVLGSLKRYKEAVSTFEQVLSAQKTLLGLSHPDTLHTLHNLASLYDQQGNFFEAQKIYNSIGHEVKTSLGEEHPLHKQFQMHKEKVNLINKLNDFKLFDIVEDAHKNLIKTVSTGDVQALHKLLMEGVNINTSDEDGRTVLHYAVNTNNKEVVKMLLAHDADITATTKKGNTVLHTAVSKRNLEMLELLLEHASSTIGRAEACRLVNKRTTSSWTAPLHVAAKDGSFEIAYALLRSGANYNVRDKENQSPEEVCSDKATKGILSLVREVFTEVRAHSGRILERTVALHPYLLPAVIGATNEDGLRPGQLARLISPSSRIADSFLFLEMTILSDVKE